MPPISAVDAIGPAFERTKQHVFRPFNFKRWFRISIIALVTGHLGGGGGGFGNAGNFNIPTHTSSDGGSKFLVNPIFNSPEVIALIAVAVAVILLMVLLWMYAASVYRFILFDCVVTGRYELRGGWSRWKYHGLRLFGFEIILSLVTLGSLGILFGFAWMVADANGALREPKEHLGLLVGGGMIVLVAFLAIALAAAIVGLFTKDFLVPVMAMEGMSVPDSWRRLFPMLQQEKGAYAVYVLMKIVLAIGSAVIFGIVDFLVLLVLAIPVIIVAAAGIFGGMAAGLSWNPYTITALIVGGTIVLTAVLWLMAFIYVPGVVFFQSYVVHFFGSRYDRLGALVSPPPPAPPPAAPPMMEPPPPLPAPG